MWKETENQDELTDNNWVLRILTVCVLLSDAKGLKVSLFLVVSHRADIRAH